MKLVFIHGSGMNSAVWKQQLAHFHDAEAIDLPGHPEGRLVNGIDDYVQFVQSYLDAQDEVILVGHSLGSAVVLKLAAERHKALKGMILIGAGGRLRVLPALLDDLVSRLAGEDSIPSSVLAMNENIAEPLRTKINAGVLANGVPVLLKDLQICDGFDVMNELGAIDLPCLIVVGDQDRMTPPKYAAYLQKALPRASLALIPGGSHMAFAEKADEVNAKVERFIAKLALE